MRDFVLEPDISASLERVTSFLPPGGIDRPDSLARLTEAVHRAASDEDGLHQLARGLRIAVGSSSDSDGYAVVDMRHAVERGPDPLVAATAICALIGRPMWTIIKSPLWKEARVKLEGDPNSFGGVGLLPLHIDHVNATMPPDWTALLCLRPDPMGGGATIIANLQRAANALSPDEVRELEASAFVEGQFYGLEGVGEELNPFPVLTPADDGLWRVRYAGKILSNLPAGPQREVLLKFARVLEETQEVITLRAGDLVIMNQRLVAHGRLPLGPGQRDVPPEQRRLCRQGHIRADPRAPLAD